MLLFISIVCWQSLVAIRWASDLMSLCPQTAEKILPVCGQVMDDSLRCSYVFTLLPMVVEKRAVRMSGRRSSLQPLLSMSFALDLYLACSRKTTRQHTHTRHATDEKPRWRSVPSKWLENTTNAQTTTVVSVLFYSRLFDGTDTSESCTLKTKSQLLFCQPVQDK